MLEHNDPKKAKMAKMVERMLRVFKGDNNPEDLHDGIAAHKELQQFIIEDWSPQDDLSYADLGELVYENVLCSCAQFGVDGTHHPDCDAWDSKAG